MSGWLAASIPVGIVPWGTTRSNLPVAASGFALPYPAPSDRKGPVEEASALDAGDHDEPGTFDPVAALAMPHGAAPVPACTYRTHEDAVSSDRPSLEPVGASEPSVREGPAIALSGLVSARPAPAGPPTVASTMPLPWASVADGGRPVGEETAAGTAGPEAPPCASVPHARSGSTPASAAFGTAHDAQASPAPRPAMRPGHPAEPPAAAWTVAQPSHLAPAVMGQRATLADARVAAPSGAPASRGAAQSASPAEAARTRSRWSAAGGSGLVLPSLAPPATPAEAERRTEAGRPAASVVPGPNGGPAADVMQGAMGSTWAGSLVAGPFPFPTRTRKATPGHPAPARALPAVTTARASRLPAMPPAAIAHGGQTDTVVVAGPADAQPVPWAETVRRAETGRPTAIVATVPEGGPTGDALRGAGVSSEAGGRQVAWTIPPPQDAREAPPGVRAWAPSGPAPIRAPPIEPAATVEAWNGWSSDPGMVARRVERPDVAANHEVARATPGSPTGSAAPSTPSARPLETGDGSEGGPIERASPPDAADRPVAPATDAARAEAESAPATSFVASLATPGPESRHEVAIDAGTAGAAEVALPNSPSAPTVLGPDRVPVALTHAGERPAIEWAGPDASDAVVLHADDLTVRVQSTSEGVVVDLIGTPDALAPLGDLRPALSAALGQGGDQLRRFALWTRSEPASPAFRRSTPTRRPTGLLSLFA